MYTSIVGGGALPTGLAPVTDCFAIRVDANTIKLADSNAHAVAGTALSFTTNGSGVLQFLIGLPYRRPRTYAKGTQLDSRDLNADFDSWIALWAFVTGQPQSIYSGMTLAGALAVGGAVSIGGNLNVVGHVSRGTQTIVLAPGLWQPAGQVSGIARSDDSRSSAADQECAIPGLVFGDRITAIRWTFIDSAGGASLSLSSVTYSTGLASSSITATNTPGSVGVFGKIAMPVTFDVATNGCPYLRVHSGGGGAIGMGPTEVDFIHP
jgi:hypothetical protein